MITKKAMVGIGTLIVFIAGILVATITAGVTLTTQIRFQNKALEVGGKVKEGVSINFQTIDVKAIKNLQTNSYDKLDFTMKLGPGSGDVKLNKTLVDIIFENSSGIYRYIGNSTFYINKKNRLINEIINSSWKRLHSDLDFDFMEDKIKIYNSTMLMINLSSTGVKNITIKNINSIGQHFNNNYTIGSEIYGTLKINGITNVSNELAKNMVTINPYDMYLGYGGYSIEYAINTNNHKKNILVEGDVYKIHIETREPLKEDSDLMFSIKKETGQIHRLNIGLPNVLIGNRVKIYP